MLLTYIGILSGLVFILGDIPYITDVVKGKTKPHRISWLIFFILDLIYIANLHSLGARNSLLLVFAWTLITFTIFSLSIKRGVGGLAKLDLFCLVGAAFGLVLWYLLKTPLASLLCNLLVSMVAYVPTIKKAYLTPGTETRVSWLTAAMAAVLSGISVGKADIKLLLLPTWSFIAAFSVFTILTVRRDRRD